MWKARKNKGQRGFTLVEVIVVAVIVAALAGVAVPVYLGYVNNSRLNSATSTAGAVASFLGSCRNSAGAASLGLGGNATNAAPVTCDVAPVGAGAEDVSINIPPNITVNHNAATNCLTATHSQGGGASQSFCY